MLKRFTKEPSPLDEPIAKILVEMETYNPVDPEYKALMKYLDKLIKLRDGKRREPVKMDTIFLVAGNLVGIFIIVAYEHNHALLSKAMTYIRPRA